MPTETRHTQPRAHAVSRRAEPCLSLSERLAIAALVSAVNLWIGIVEVGANRIASSPPYEMGKSK